METINRPTPTLNVIHILAILALIGLAVYGGMKWQAYKGSVCNGSLTEKTCALRTGMRQLWTQHVGWTRDYIIAAVADAENVKEVTERLLRNQDDIGNAVAQYYGTDAGKKLTALLKDHILISADVVAAAKAGDQPKLKEADKRWHDNAKDLADFLSSANPYWPQSTILAMLNEHLKLTTEEATARIKKQWARDIKMFDAVFEQAMDMADSLTNGIVKQFPDKF